MTPTENLKMTLISLGLGGIALWRSFKKLKTKRLIEDTPTSRTRSAAQGLSEFQGFAWPLSNLTKCSLQNECVYYSLRLEKHVKRGKNSSWETLFSTQSTSEFLLLDSTGAVQIDVQNADLSVQNRTLNWAALSTEAQNHLLSQHLPADLGHGFPPGSGFFGGLFGGNFRITENYILLGSPLLIMGDYKSFPSGSHIAPEVFEISSFFAKVQSDPRLKVGLLSSFFDLNKDGKVDASEMRKSLYYMARAALNSKNSESKIPVPLHGLVQKSQNHDLIILDSHEIHLRENGNWFHYLTFAAGIALILFGVYLMLHKPFVS